MADAPAAAAPFAPLVAAINAAFGGELATLADIDNAVAPLATQAQVNVLAAQVNALAAQVNALAVQIAALPTLAQIQALLAPHNAPAVAAAAAATVQAIVAARLQNAHDHRGVAYVMVPRTDGTPPPNWPLAGFDRDALTRGNIAIVNALLNDYGLPLPAATRDRRDTLAHHIGTMRT